MNLDTPQRTYDFQYAASRYTQYKKIIEEKIHNHQIPHNKKWKQGFFIPKKAMKCMNIMETDEPKPIIFRSGWEHDFCKFCDDNQAVIRWGSEIVQILYKDPIRNKMAFYFPDFYIEYIDKDKTIRKVMIEIKPLKEATLSEAKNGYDRLCLARNAMKWKAAIEFCKKRGMEFKVLHEGNLSNSFK